MLSISAFLCSLSSASYRVSPLLLDCRDRSRLSASCFFFRKSGGRCIENERREKVRGENREQRRREREKKSILFTFLVTSSGTLPPKPSAAATRPPPADAREETALPPPPREVRFFREVEDIFYLCRLQNSANLAISLARSLATQSSNVLALQGGTREPASVRALSR